MPPGGSSGVFLALSGRSRGGWKAKIREMSASVAGQKAGGADGNAVHGGGKGERAHGVEGLRALW